MLLLMLKSRIHFLVGTGEVYWTRQSRAENDRDGATESRSYKAVTNDLGRPVICSHRRLLV